MQQETQTYQAPSSELSKFQKAAPQRFLVAGGGTGGHIFPAVAVANALKKLQPNASFLFVGAQGKMEMEKIPQAGYQIEGLDIAGFNRSNPLKNISLPYKIIKSFLQVRTIINKFQPTAAIGVGGYSTFPVLKLAQKKNIPTFIHESNAFAGKANKMLAPLAKIIFVANTGMQKFFPEKLISLVGNPVRQSIKNVTEVNKGQALKTFGLDAAKKTIFVMGGSLGAQSINESVAANLDFFDQNNLQLIWQTGLPYAEVAKQKAANNPNIYVSAFIEKMENAYAAADIIVSRSGAMTIAELCIVGKPAILVPYPFAAENHQMANAMELVNQNAAVVIADDEVRRALTSVLNKLLHNTSKQEELSKNISSLAVHNADEIIADDILEYLTSIHA